jgi:hypothetical protein
MTMAKRVDPIKMITQPPSACPSCGAVRSRIDLCMTEKEGRSIVERWGCADCYCEWENAYEWAETSIVVPGEAKQ